MTPQRRGFIPQPELDRLTTALTGKADADEEVKEAVAAALRAGGSVREVAAVTGLSTRTVQTYGHARGWPTRQQLANLAETRRRNAEFEAMLRIQATQEDE